MLTQITWQHLRSLLQERQIGAGIALLDHLSSELVNIQPDHPGAGSVVGCLAQWVDVGFEGMNLLETLLARFPASARHELSLVDYVHLRLAEALVAMRHEDLPEALRRLDTALTVCQDTEDSQIVAVASLWKARCLRKAGEYDQALAIARQGIARAVEIGAPQMAAVVRTLESWLLFQRGETKQALAILQEAEAVLRDTDDFITLGNIQSSYGRIALREGRYDHAMQYFEASIDIYKRRSSLEGYLARSLTNTAQAKRFAALQLRRSIDSSRARDSSRDRHFVTSNGGKLEKTAQLERMHELLQQALDDLAKADEIYKRMGNHHGAGNVDVNLASVYLDLGDLDKAEERAAEAFELGATKADYLLMCRARVVQALLANARFEEQIGESEDLSRFAQLAHDCAKEAVDLGAHTESRRLRAQALICQGLTLVNGFFNNTEAARACCHRAEEYLDHDRHDALWQEVEILRAKVLHGGIEDPNLRAWSQGEVGNKSLRAVVADFEELLIHRVWEREGRKVSRVAQRLAVSPKKVRRVLRHLGVINEAVL
jgi:tetratricopeptide (TPR) repeat protein